MSVVCWNHLGGRAGARGRSVSTICHIDFMLQPTSTIFEEPISQHGVVVIQYLFRLASCFKMNGLDTIRICEIRKKIAR